MRLLDMVAYAAVALLGATEAFIGRGDANAWQVVGCSLGAGAGLDGRGLAGVDRLADSTVVPLTLDVPGSGPVRLTPAETDADGTMDAVAYAGSGGDDKVVLVVVERPTLGTRAEQQARLGEIHAAAVDAVAEASERESRLRAGLEEREEERRRWARELHDETLQQLGALQVLLSTVHRYGEQSDTRHGQADPQMLEVVDTATDLVRGQIAGLRHLITELRPATLDDLGLRPPLYALAERTEQLGGLPVDVHVSLRYFDGDIATRLLPDVELAVYRVVQEALTNASRHSGANRAEVSVVEDDDVVHVEVRDNGHGLTDSRTIGFGVPGMRERAQLAGGTLDVLTGPQTPTGTGTVVRMRVPAQHRDPPTPTPDTSESGTTAPNTA